MPRCQRHVHLPPFANFPPMFLSKLFDSISSYVWFYRVHWCRRLCTMKRQAFKIGTISHFALWFSVGLWADDTYSCTYQYCLVSTCIFYLFSCAVVSPCFYFEIDSYKGLNKGHGCKRSAGQRRVWLRQAVWTQRVADWTPTLPAWLGFFLKWNTRGLQALQNKIRLKIHWY